MDFYGSSPRLAVPHKGRFQSPTRIRWISTMEKEFLYLKTSRPVFQSPDEDSLDFYVSACPALTGHLSQFQSPDEDSLDFYSQVTVGGEVLRTSHFSPLTRIRWISTQRNYRMPESALRVSVP